MAMGSFSAFLNAELTRPNIIFAMTDDQGWADTGNQGHPWLKTPNLDAMAEAGLRLDRFYVATPKCSPTRASVVTGRHPERFLFENGVGFPATERTIGQILSEQGYATGIFGKWHLGGMNPERANFPTNLGFQRVRTENLQFDVDPVLYHEDGRHVAHSGDSSGRLVTECLEFAREASESGKPFMALIWFTAPHTPLAPTEADRAAAEAMKAKAGKKAVGGVTYYAELIEMDRAMGQLRSGLREMGLAENTLIWWCSDNGGVKAYQNQPLRGTKFTIWEGGVRVPGIIEWPAQIPKGSVTEVPVSSMDFVPTVAGILGIQDVKSTGPLDGIDIRELFSGKMKERPKPLPVAWAGPYGMIDNQFKIIKGNPSAKQWKKDRETWHLYRVDTDPGETTNLVEEEPEVFARLRKDLEAWIEEISTDPGRKGRKPFRR